MKEKKSCKPFWILLLIIALGLGYYFFIYQAEQEDEKTPIDSEEVEASINVTAPESEDVSASINVTEDPAEEPTEEAEIPSFETLDEYLTYSLEDPTAEQFKSSTPPEGFERVSFGDQEVSIAPKGVDFFDAHVLGETGYDNDNFETIMPFYIETVQYDLEKEEEMGGVENTEYSTYYGPFEGKLLQLIQ